MKTLSFLTLSLLFTLFTLSCASKPLKVTVANPNDFSRANDLVEIPLTDIQTKITLTPSLTFIVRDSEGEVVPSQITHDGKLIFQAGVNALSVGEFTIEAGAPQKYTPKTCGRIVPERYDDFSWENDQIAFRIYGHALVAIDGPSNGIDLWFKRTHDLVTDEWYKKELEQGISYHVDHGQGMDGYKVGRTLGAGAMAPFVNDTLWLNDNFIKQEILDDGPLRTCFQLTYNSVHVAGQSYPETRTFTLDAGSQFTKVVENYSNVSQAIPVAAGIVKRAGADTVVVDSSYKYMIYAEPYDSINAQVFVGVVFPEGFDRTLLNTYKIEKRKPGKYNTFSHYLAVATYQPNTPLTYYTGYGWSKFGYTNLAEYNTYVKHFTQSLARPLIVKF